MNEFFFPVLSGIVATLIATGLIYACGAVVKRVKDNPGAYSDEITRVAASLMVVVLVSALIGTGWLLHQVIEAVLAWAAQVAETPGTGFDDVPQTVRDAVLGHTWPWQYTCAAFVLLAPVSATEGIVDQAKEEMGLIRRTFARVVLAASVLLLVAAVTGAVIGAHVALDAAMAWAFTAHPAYFPGLAQAWSLPWGTHWTALVAAAVASGYVQYIGFVINLKLGRAPA